MASIFDVMQNDPTLKVNLKAAQNTAPDARIDNKLFPGADGEYIWCFVRMNSFEAKECPVTEFQYRCVGGPDPEGLGFMANDFTMWKDSANRTKQECQNGFFGTCQQLGVNTPALTLPEIDAALKELAGKTYFKGSIATSSAGFKNVRILSLCEAPEDAPDAPEEDSSTETIGTLTTGSWESLGTSAEDGDEEAQAELLKHTPEGEDPDNYEWAELADLIASSQVVETPEEESEPDPDWTALGDAAGEEDAEAQATLLLHCPIGEDPDNYEWAELAALIKTSREEGFEEEQLH